MNELQALYGGTFDPIHYGHLRSTEFLANLIGLQRIIIMPNNVPLYRQQPEVSSVHRRVMLELAIADNPLFHLDECALHQNSPSYTSQVLRQWHAKCVLRRPLAFIIGQDSLLNFPSWYQYKTILDYSHLIVCRRPGYPLLMKEKRHQRWLKKHLTHNADDLRTREAGNIYLAETPWFNISATIIRDRLQRGQSCRELIPPQVLDYILRNGLYQKSER